MTSWNDRKSTLSAQTDKSVTLQLTLADAVQRAVEHNPDLAIVRLGTEVEAPAIVTEQTLTDNGLTSLDVDYHLVLPASAFHVVV